MENFQVWLVTEFEFVSHRGAITFPINVELFWHILVSDAFSFLQIAYFIGKF